MRTFFSFRNHEFFLISILGVNFIDCCYNLAIKKLKSGCLMVVPSGPGLATIGKDLRYTEAVQNADFAIPDSGYMVLLLRLLKGIKINKFSGYYFFKNFFKENFNKNDLFLIDPNKEESKINNAYLNKIGIPIKKSFQYVAPIYGNGKIEDKFLINRLNTLTTKPKYIMINLGSGVQEPLGHYLKQNLNFNPGIICTGAAIAFFTGRQANISPFIDKLSLGWLWRCIRNPKVFIPRYLSAFSLLFLILKADVKVIK
jgi:N-acetylglucosaminyldiphosphoundecaprenol N-acetyl-beta-D-mannosaminyltransferase